MIRFSTGYEEVNTYYYHTDHLGSAQLITDYEGEQYEHIEYTPYGELWIEDTSDDFNKIPVRFTGKEFDDETGLYYYGARYLNPRISRWASADPAGFDLINPLDNEGKAKENYSIIEGLNWYSYTANNPVKYTDPTGNNLWDVIKSAASNLWEKATYWHYEGRENKNDVQEDYDDIQKDIQSSENPEWRLEKRDVFHQDGEEYHDEKYCNKHGREIIFDGASIHNGNPEIDMNDKTKGTCNYVDPGKKPSKWYDIIGWIGYGAKEIGHTFADVLPYAILGNSRRKEL